MAVDKGKWMGSRKKKGYRTPTTGHTRNRLPPTHDKLDHKTSQKESQSHEKKGSTAAVQKLAFLYTYVYVT